MNEEEPIVFEPTPKLKSSSCKLLALAFVVVLYSIPFIFGFVGWVYYDGFVGFGFFCLGYLVNGIVHSKIRQMSIPLDQLENSYTTKEIATWFVSRYLMCR